VYARLEKFGLRPEPPRKATADSSESVAAAAEPPPPDTGLPWERRSLTLLRADLTSPDTVNAWSQSSRALDAVITKVHSFGGRVEELTPTGLVAAFGLEPAEDAPRRAAHAAIAIQKGAVRARESGDNVPESAIGLHVAPLPIGYVGSRIEIDAAAMRAEWLALDRLMQSTTPGETVVSLPAAPFLERRFELERLDERLEGEGPFYRLTGQERRGLGLWGAMTQFVGRENEFETVRSRLDLAGRGHGQVVAVVGEAGVGKSRLIYEFAAAQRLEGWQVLEGTSVSYGRAMSYLPIIDLLKRYFKIQDRDEAREIPEKVTERLLALDTTLQATLPAFLALLDVPTDDPSWRILDPPQRRQRTHDAVRRLLLREAREQPLLLIFEDLHWVDSETQAVLDGLVDSLAFARLLLLVTYRPEYQHAWGNKTCYCPLALNVLSPSSTGQFLDALLGRDPGLAPLKELLVKRGNPFFLEETVRTLVETQALEGAPGRYRLTQPLPTIQVPPTVQAVLAARIAGLPAKDKQLLQTASVIGKDVPNALLQAVADLPADALRQGLDRLRAVEFLYETGLYPDLKYTFKHALTHEVTYEALPQQRRRGIHARLVGAIEVLHRDRLGEQIEHLAHHALRGDLGEKAASYLRQAGVKAAARSALLDARSWFEQALGVLAALPESRSTLEQAFDIRLELRPVLNLLGELRRVLERLREAETLAEKLNDDHRRGRVCAVVTNVHALVGELVEALVTGTRALEIARRLGDLRLRILTTTYLEQVHYFRGDYERVVELAADNLAALPADSDYEYFGNAMPASVYDRSWLVRSLAELGRFAEAVPYEAEALRLAEATHHAFTVGFAHRAASWLHLNKGDWAKASSLIEHGISAFHAGNTVLALPHAVAASAWVLAQVGETSEALTRFRESKQLLERHAARGIVGWKGEAYHSLGRAGLLLGWLDEARSLGDHAVDSSAGYHGFAAHAQHLLGDIAIHPDRFDAESGESHYRKALALAEPRRMRPLVAHCHLGLGKLYRRTGEREQAREHLSTATVMYREMDMRFWLDQVAAETAALG
jgi:tetratricopeptide (TPR) repeat protein